MASNIKHSSKSSNWYTPVWLIEKCRTVLGSIDFDPASDVFGNSRVRADIYFSARALEKTWPNARSVFVNPPGGKVGNASQAALFWKRTVEEWATGKFQHGLFVGFSIEILQTSQSTSPGGPLQAFPFWVPAKRFGFDTRAGGSKHPSHAPCIAYLPPDNARPYVDLFRKTFEPLGYVRT